MSWSTESFPYSISSSRSSEQSVAMADTTRCGGKGANADRESTGACSGMRGMFDGSKWARAWSATQRSSAEAGFYSSHGLSRNGPGLGLLVMATRRKNTLAPGRYCAPLLTRVSCCSRVAGAALRKRDEDRRTVAMGQNGSDARRGRRQLIQVVPEIVGEVVAPGSASYAAARTLQAMRFATASKPRDQAHQDVSYLQAVEIAANHTIHIVARREAAVRPQASTSRRRPSAGSVVGTVRLELPGASIVEAVVQFAPGSSAASARARQRFLEIGGFATTADLSLLELIDVIDTLAATIVAVATQRAIEWLWMFPRLPVMRLFLAELDELPAYRFALCHDVSSWVESHEQLAALRRLGLKEFETAATARPVVYVARVETLAADLARRLAARANRVEAPQLDERLGEAMLQAYRRVRRDVHRFQHEGHLTERTVLRYCLPPAPTLPTASPLDLDDLRPPQIISRPRTRITPPLSQRTPSIGGPLPPAPAVPSETAEEKSTDFLPYAAVPD